MIMIIMSDNDNHNAGNNGIMTDDNGNDLNDNTNNTMVVTKAGTINRIR